MMSTLGSHPRHWIWGNHNRSPTLWETTSSSINHLVSSRALASKFRSVSPNLAVVSWQQQQQEKEDEEEEENNYISHVSNTIPHCSNGPPKRKKGSLLETKHFPTSLVMWSIFAPVHPPKTMAKAFAHLFSSTYLPSYSGPQILHPKYVCWHHQDALRGTEDLGPSSSQKLK